MGTAMKNKKIFIRKVVESLSLDHYGGNLTHNPYKKSFLLQTQIELIINDEMEAGRGRVTKDH